MNNIPGWLMHLEDLYKQVEMVAVVQVPVPVLVAVVLVAVVLVAGGSESLLRTSALTSSHVAFPFPVLPVPSQPSFFPNPTTACSFHSLW